MKKEAILTKNDDKDDNVIDFAEAKAQAKTGGMEPPDSANWLKDLPEGALFFAKKRNEITFELAQFFLAQHFEHVTVLRQQTPDNRVLDFPVLSKVFSLRMECVEIPLIVERGTIPNQEQNHEQSADTSENPEAS